MRFSMDIQKKNEKGENRIQEIKSSIERNKLLTKQKSLESREIIQKF